MSSEVYKIAVSIGMQNGVFEVEAEKRVHDVLARSEELGVSLFSVETKPGSFALGFFGWTKDAEFMKVLEEHGKDIARRIYPIAGLTFNV